MMSEEVDDDRDLVRQLEPLVQTLRGAALKCDIVSRSPGDAMSKSWEDVMNAVRRLEGEIDAAQTRINERNKR